MKIFLGGTCNDSKWREKLIPMLDIEYFNPVVPEWNDEAYQRELLERETCDFCLYTITPRMTGFYSIAEAVDDSNKRPQKTILCVLENDEDFVYSSAQLKSLKAVEKMVGKNGGVVFDSLENVAAYVNGFDL